MAIALSHQEFLVSLPGLGNGYPVPLPGPMAAWDLKTFKIQGRTIGQETYRVTAWMVPPELSLSPLRALLADWRAAHGEGFVSPQAASVLAFIDGLRALLREGPLLPTLAPPPEALFTPEPALAPSADQPLAWVPPVSLAQVHAFRALLERDPRLSSVGLETEWYTGPARAVSVLTAERFPVRLARFLVEALGATAAREATAPEGASPWRDEDLRAALARGDLGPVHAAYGSCLHPHHALFGPSAVPIGHLHARVHPEASPEHPERAWRVDLGLASEGAFLPLPRLLEEASLHHSAVEHEGAVWRRPAAVLYRDWTHMALVLPGVFLRPELLAAGRCALDEDDAQALLAVGDVRAGRDAMRDFLVREGLDPATWRKREYVAFSASPGRGGALRLRVRWDFLGDPATGDVAGSALLLFRFVPKLSLTIGDDELPPEEAEAILEASGASFLQVRGRVVARADVEQVVELAKARARVLQKLRVPGSGIPWTKVVELDDEWSAERDAARLESVFSAQWERFLAGLKEGAGVPMLATPAGFRGALRPYQSRGLSWLAFLLERGLGACLADDMGLGKTVQVLALLWEQRRPRDGAAARPPDLVVCPTSVVTNWAREAKRFAPGLRVYVHQGAGRAREAGAFAQRARESDLVVTSYALARRDRALLGSVPWDVLVADEAQNLKNPGAQQTQALKALEARRRVALTGTPVENRLRDLWSVFDFVLPGLLGGPTRFARTFLTPLREGDPHAVVRLQKRVGPFLLRRTKRDPAVAADLPDKQEQVVYCELTREQASLYRAMVEATLGGLATKSGMQRRAHILGALTRLKQICNHPENFSTEDPHRLFGRSGKLDRLAELLEELVLEDQATLVFTQFTEMGELLRRALEERFGMEALYYHGGLSPRAREEVVEDFQAEGGPPILLVSLRAGGTGLNLTRASAVIHYDRWWNPAVEDQATDRAHRIGQTQRVNVYKFVTRATLEERIQAIIEEKRELATRVLASSGEAWLTEMNDEELRAFLALGEVGDDAV